ncbi:MAG: hypothetical protein ACRCYU_10945 [Nocardioides sp.]
MTTTATVQTPSEEDLTKQRSELLDEAQLTEVELRTRAEVYQLSPRQSEILTRLEEIAYLLGE